MTQAQDIGPPLVLDADSILAIHRHDDGQIAVAKKRPPDAKHPEAWWEWLFMLTPSMLRGTFRAFQEWLLQDGCPHFSLQAFHRTAPAGWTDKTTGLPAIGVDRYRPRGQRRFGRVTENLRYLNCLSCDIDCGRSDQDAKNDLEKVPWREAQRRVEDLQDAGVIPAMSMYGYSGRGLYAIWLLHSDRDPERSAPAYDHDVVLWKAVQAELVRRVESAPLPVDHAGSLITQVYKVGGAPHPKTGNRAEYFITAQADRQRRLISYRLSELAAALDLQALDGDLPNQTRKLARPAQTRRVKNPGSAPLRSYGHKARHAHIASDMLTILQHRLVDGSGGWRKRSVAYADEHRSPVYGRWKILSLYAHALVRSMYSPKELRPPATVDPGTRQEILDQLRDMAAKCQQPFPEDARDHPEAILDAVLTEYQLVRSPKTGDLVQMLPPTPSTKTLLAAFGVTADLARELRLKTIVPDEVKRERDQARPLQADVIQARHEWLRQYILDHPGKWTAQRVVNLSNLSPFDWNQRQTANDDLNAIGCKVRSRGGRPRRQAQTGGGAVEVPSWLKSSKVGK